MSLVDAHCHIQDRRLSPSLELIIDRARKAGVTTVHSCGTSANDWTDLLNISLLHANFVKTSYGLHPWFVNSRSDNWYDLLQSFLIQDSKAGIGEIGLDRVIDQETWVDQVEVFERQFELAIKLSRVTTVHCRKAFDSLETILDKFAKKNSFMPKVIIHSFGGSLDQLKQLMKYPFVFFSFSGKLLSENAKKMRDCVTYVPLDRLLLESDSPDMFPLELKPLLSHDCLHDNEGKCLNEPSVLKYIYEKVAQLRAMPLEDLVDSVKENI